MLHLLACIRLPAFLHHGLRMHTLLVLWPLVTTWKPRCSNCPAYFLTCAHLFAANTKVSLCNRPEFFDTRQDWNFCGFRAYFPFYFCTSHFTSHLQAMNGSISSVSICLAYVADKLAPGHRAACFGLILASFSMGILIGPPIGGLLPPIVASYTAMSCVVASLLYVVVVLEESLSERSRNEVSQRAEEVHGTFACGVSAAFIHLVMCCAAAAAAAVAAAAAAAAETEHNTGCMSQFVYGQHGR